MPYLVLLFTLVPIIELYLLIKVGGYIGAFNTVALVLFTGIVGAILARMEGFRVWIRIQQDLSQGIMPTARLLDGLFILVGGVLLITPGLVTDIVGFLLIIPFTRILLKDWLRRKFEEMVQQGRVITVHRFGRF